MSSHFTVVSTVVNQTANDIGSPPLGPGRYPRPQGVSLDPLVGGWSGRGEAKPFGAQRVKLENYLTKGNWSEFSL